MSVTEFKYIPEIDIKTLKKNVKENISKTLEYKVIGLEIAFQLKRIADKLS